MLSLFSLDIAEKLQLSFQESASPVMEEIINFHNEVMVYLCFILLAVFWVMIESCREYSKSKKLISHKYLIHGTVLEIV
jgi:heme/copper-type cytochrome/quinol oxidase subunit 2